VRLWGTRGSLAAPGPDTVRYGGNTSCVQVSGRQGTQLILDAGTGIRLAGPALGEAPRRVDILLTHLHMDHIQGLGFFGPLRQPGAEVHIWGPSSTTQGLGARLTRYMSPPTFPVLLRELQCSLQIHQLPAGDFDIGEFRVSSQLVCHPNPTVGYRLQTDEGVVTYLPDHEPALGVTNFPMRGEWTSGFALAEGADLLIHDAQYSSQEYQGKVGFGHSSIDQTVAFARLTGAARLVPFHHDPSHDDDLLDQFTAAATAAAGPNLAVLPGQEGRVFELTGA
ncbi:MAG: MBL fold metallo-hydrolase, partial [Anaerolineales bacterium]